MMMKNLLFALLGLFALFAFSDCGKDDDIDVVEFKNEFTYDDTTYALDEGFINDRGANLGGSHDFDIFLTTAGISRADSNSLTGVGDLVYLDLYTASNTGLNAGTYDWSVTVTAGSISPSSAVFLTYNFDTAIGFQIPATDGTVDVAIDGMETTITFNLIFPAGKTATGQWRGTLEDI